MITSNNSFTGATGPDEGPEDKFLPTMDQQAIDAYLAELAKQDAPNIFNEEELDLVLTGLWQKQNGFFEGNFGQTIAKAVRSALSHQKDRGNDSFKSTLYERFPDLKDQVKQGEVSLAPHAQRDLIVFLQSEMQNIPSAQADRAPERVY